MIKALPKHADGFRKVKVRKKKVKDLFEEQFNKSFFTEFNEIRNRAVFVNGTQPVSSDTELFYVFPINGYRFMYSPTVHDSTELYKDTFDKLIRSVGDTGMDIFKEMLQLSYTYEDLQYGINQGCEVIIYDIPYYYAIRTSLVDDYRKWFYNT